MINIKQELQLFRINPQSQREINEVTKLEYINGKLKHFIHENDASHETEYAIIGCGKKNTNIFYENRDIHYGDDYAGFRRITNQLSYCFIFDGHGRKGAFVSKASANIVNKLILENETTIINYFTINKFDEVTKFLEELFFDADEQLLLETETMRIGGSTCMIVFHIQVNNKSYLVSVNYGDSPAILVDNKHFKATEIFHESSFNNIIEYQYIVDNAIYQKVKPPEVIYSRINAGTSLILNKDNNFAPFPIYTIINNKVEINRESLKDITQNKHIIPGGHQSLRKFTKQIYDEITGKWIDYNSLYGYEHENCGATNYKNGKGCSQVSRKFGDHEFKKDKSIIRIPSVYIHQLTPDFSGTVIIGSDGFFDIFYYHEIADIISTCSHLSPSDICNKLYDIMLEKASLTTIFKVDKEIPKWDDVSICVMKIDKKFF